MKQYFAKRASSLWVLALLTVGVSFGLSLASCETSYGQVHVYLNYVPPSWAPPYDNVSTIRYYYLPDYDMYYDVWERQYYYFDGNEWVATYDVPPMLSGVSLSSAFVVLINRSVDRPWMNHDYYVRNYPAHAYTQYRDIVVKNRIITNLRPDHELVPRAYNENNKRVTFMQRPTQSGAAPQNPAYHQQVHEVPIKTIAPSMPAESRKFNYGGGQNRPPRNMPAPAQRNAPAPPQHNAPAQRNAPAPAQHNAPAPGRQNGQLGAPHGQPDKGPGDNRR
jgi:hypothetical protein